MFDKNNTRAQKKGKSLEREKIIVMLNSISMARISSPCICKIKSYEDLGIRAMCDAHTFV